MDLVSNTLEGFDILHSISSIGNCLVHRLIRSSTIHCTSVLGMYTPRCQKLRLLSSVGAISESRPI